MIFRQALGLIAMALAAICVCSAQKSSEMPSKTYQLHSWQDSDGTWNFCVLPSADSEHCVLRGLGELKKRISGLPSGTVVYWIDRTPGTGSNLGSYPPPSVIKQVKEYAGKRKVKIELMSSNPLAPTIDAIGHLKSPATVIFP